MLNYLIKKIAYGFLVLMGVITTIFLLFNVLPGDPARLMLGQRANEESIKIIREDLGLNRSLSTQYLMYVNDVMPLSVYNDKNKESAFYLDNTKYDFTPLFHVGGNHLLVLKTPYLRRSYQTKRKVTKIIADTLPETAVLALAAILIATILGIFLGIIAAIKKGSVFDNGSLFFAVLGMSGPSFWIGIIISYLFGYVLSKYTGLNMTGSLWTIDDYGNGEYLTLQNLILPAIALGIRPLAVILQLTRNSMLEVLSKDYIRTAKAKGLKFSKVITKHALKNALNPVVTTISGMFASLLAGALFTEMIFGWRGIGWTLYNALMKYDLPVVMGIVLVIAVIFVVINIIVDIIYAVLDPRVRYS